MEKDRLRIRRAGGVYRCFWIEGHFYASEKENGKERKGFKVLRLFCVLIKYDQD
jgi:hypothetical protein